MFFLLRAFFFRSFRLRPLRMALTIAGIFIGVALGVGVGLLNESMLASFQEFAKGVAENADLRVTVPGRAGMPGDVVDRVAAAPGVRAAAPTVRVTGFLQEHPKETVVLVGVDALADKAFLPARAPGAPVDPLAFLNVPNAVVLSRSLADRIAAHLGDSLRVVLQGRSVSMTVKGIVEEAGAAKLYGGNVLVVDLYGSEAALGRSGYVDQIDVLAKPGVSLALLGTNLARALGPGYQIEQPGQNRQAEQMLTGIRKTTGLLGLLALFVGMFLIFNTLGTAVAQRRWEIGSLRAIGVTRDQILVLFLCEALLLGFVGALLGVAGGVGLAKVLLSLYAQAISNLYFQAHPDVVHLSLGLLARHVALGVGASFLAAAIPAWRAAAVSPLEALAETPLESGRVRRFRLLFALGIAALGIEALFLLRSGVGAMDVGVVSTVVSFAALALLTPGLVAVLGALLGPPLARVFGLEARLGGDNVMRSVGRTAVTVATLMVGITLAVSIGGSFVSLSTSIDDWINTGVTQDVMVRGSVNMPGVNAVTLPEGMDAVLRQVPGVADVSAFREAPVTLATGPIIQIIAMGTDAQMRHDTRHWFEGDPVAGRTKMVGRGYALISENVSNRNGLHVGDKLAMMTPSGPASLEVAGVQVDFGSDLGTAVINHDDYTALFKDPGVDAYNLWLQPGADAAAVRAAIQSKYPGVPLFIQTNAEFRAEIHQAVTQLFALSDVVQVLVIIIAMIGIINTLLVSILDRTRELGMMRAVGFTRAQLARVILWEGAFMGIMAGLLGAISGSLFSLSIIHLVNRQLVGWSTAYVFPGGIVWKGFLVAVVSAVAAGWVPARRAARLNIVSAMEYR